MRFVLRLWAIFTKCFDYYKTAAAELDPISLPVNCAESTGKSMCGVPFNSRQPHRRQ